MGIAACLAVGGLFFASRFWPAGGELQGDAESSDKQRASSAVPEGPPESSPVPPEAETVPAEPPTPSVSPSTPTAEHSALPPGMAGVPSRPAYVPLEPVGPLPTTIEGFKKEELEVAARLAEDFPNSADPIGVLGMVHQAHGNTAEAIKCWEKCLELDPERADAYNGMGWVALRKGEHEKALALWRKAIQIDPNARNVHGRMARALMGLGKMKKAVSELEKQIEISPHEAMNHYLAGEAHLQLRQYEKAIECYREAIEIVPDLKSPYYGLGVACARLGQLEESRKYREKFKELQTKDLNELIEEAVTRDDVAEASQTLAQTLTDAGRVYLKQGGLRKAEKHWRRAAALDPENTQCRVRLAMIYQRSQRLREALEISEQLVQIEPENVIHRFNAGVLNGRLRRFGPAEEMLRKVVELEPEFAPGYAELARVLLRAKKNLPEARTLASTAVRLEPIAHHYSVLSEAHGKNGDLKSSLEAVERAAELEPGNAKYRRVRDLLKRQLLENEK